LFAFVCSKNYSEEAIQLFKRALLIDPSNVMTTLWYAKLLKKLNKFGQAELMYKVALEKSKGMLRLEPTAICNYATFIFKQRKDPEKAQALFTDGLERCVSFLRDARIFVAWYCFIYLPYVI
jgi:Tfp pilus assembly protein PilF